MMTTTPAPMRFDEETDPYRATLLPEPAKPMTLEEENARLRRRLFVARCHAVIWRCATEANQWTAAAELARRSRRTSHQLVSRLRAKANRWAARCDRARRLLITSGAADVALIPPLQEEP